MRCSKETSPTPRSFTLRAQDSFCRVSRQKLLIATQNKGKYEEFWHLLKDGFAVQFPPSPPAKLKETGNSYYENALTKALSYFNEYHLPVLADDSGLEVDALKGRPGVFSARFGGENISWNARWDYLLHELSPFSERNWTARFLCVLCYYNGVKEPVFFQGVTEGRITREINGENGFGYDPIFFSNDLNMTFGTALLEAKQKVSHRARAIREFLVWCGR